MSTFQTDKFAARLAIEVQRASDAYAHAPEAGRAAARARRDTAKRRMDAYLHSSAELSDRERRYAVANNWPASALVKARAKLPAHQYQAAIKANAPLPADTPEPSIPVRTVGRLGIARGVLFTEIVKAPRGRP